jgi:hypothetical protein
MFESRCAHRVPHPDMNFWETTGQIRKPKTAGQLTHLNAKGRRGIARGGLSYLRDGT